MVRLLSHILQETQKNLKYNYKSITAYAKYENEESYLLFLSLIQR